MTDLEINEHYFRMASAAFQAMSEKDQEQIIYENQNEPEDPHWKRTLRAIEAVSKELKEVVVMAPHGSRIQKK